jgi:hypothetical protein
MRQHRLSFVVCSGVLVFALGAAAVVLPGVASADATDDYPIPHRMIITTRTAEQILAAYGEPLAFQWPNWAKIFFNNKGVDAKETENCASHPPDDESVWDG